MAFKTYSAQLEKPDNGITLFTTGLNDSILFTRTAYYTAFGTGSHVLVAKRSVSIGIDGFLGSSDGSTVSVGGASDVRVGATGGVTANGGTAIEAAGTAFSLLNRGEVSGLRGLVSTADDSVLTNTGAITGKYAVQLTGTTATVDNSGDLIGSAGGLRIDGNGGGQQVDNSGHISGGRGTAIDVRTNGDVSIVNSGEVSGRTGINLDTYVAGDAGERTITNTGTIVGQSYAVYGSSSADTLHNEGHLIGTVDLYGGDDTYEGQLGSAAGLVMGGAGDDTLFGSIDARNRLSGGDGDDVLTGGDRNDLLIGGAGNDALDGGAGFDIASFRDATAGVTASLVPGDPHSAGDTYVSIEGLEGSAFADSLTGDAGDNRLIGGAGNDFLDGNLGDDTLIGGLGDDTYYWAPGDTVIEKAGEGSDTYNIQASVVTYSVSLPDNVENIDFNSASATTGAFLYGNAVDNRISVYYGSCTINGGLGNDTLFLSHIGASAEQVSFSTALGPNNVDTIYGYDPGKDSIRLYSSVFGLPGNTDGTLLASAFYVGAAAHDADDRVIYNASTGALFFDYDGTGAGAQVQFAQLNGGVTLTAAEFFVT